MGDWRFPLNDGGQMNGINANYDAKFKSSRIPSLAREICQNSLDAKNKTLGDSKPVIIEFVSFKVKNEKFPMRDNFKEYLDDCYNYWLKKGQENEIIALDHARKCLDKGEIHFLRISDFNTTGVMRQSAENGWDNLVRSSGSSNKADGAGGSYGLGKAAPFACSDLKTVFYSTFTLENEHLHQGVAHFATFEGKDGTEYQSVGYYCEGKNNPIEEELNIDSSFSRGNSNYGTDIYIAGFFEEDDEWVDELLSAVVDNFLFAVFQGELEVRANGKVLNKNNLKKFIEGNKKKVEKEDLFYNVLTKTEPDVHHKKCNFNGMGNIDIWIIENDPNCNRKVKMIRKNGMAICDWNHFKNVPFAGICWISGQELNKRLRKLENPEHTEWKSDNLPTKKERDEANRLLKALRKEIKNYIEELFKSTQTKDMDIAGLGGILPDELEISDKAGTDKGENISETPQPAQFATQIDITAEEEPPIIPSGADNDNNSNEYADESAIDGGENPSAGLENSTDDKVSGGNGSGSSGDGIEIRPGTNTTNTACGGKEKSAKKNSISLSSARVICLNPTRGIYRLIATPKESVNNAELEISLSAETDNFPAKIISAECDNKTLSIKENTVLGLQFNKDKKFVMDVVLDTDFYCSLEVKAYETKA